MFRRARFQAFRWRVASIVSVAVVAAGLAGGVPQAASASPGTSAAAVKAAPALTPAEAAAQLAAKVPASAKAAQAAATAGQQALAAARQTKKPVAVTADQTSFSQTAANPDGSFTTSASVLPRWVQSGSSWVSADPALARQANGSYAPKAALSPLSLSGGGSDMLATTASGSQSLSLTWPSALPAPAVSGATATYANVFPGVNLVVTANVSGGFSQTLVILNKTAAADPQLANLSLGLSASAGLTAHPGSDGSLAEEDSAGKPVFYSPAPAAWDSSATGASISGPGSGGKAVAAPASYSAGSVKLGVPASLLSGPASSFPVYVDPSYNDAAFWNWYGELQSAYPAASTYNDTSDSAVSAGYNPTESGIDRGNYTFGLPDSADTSAVTVSAATMTAEAVYAYNSGSQAHTVNAFATSQYNSSSTWNNPPAISAGPVGATFTTTSSYPDQNVSWNVASWLQSAFNAHAYYLSAELQNSDETDAAPFIEFANNPTLTFTYTQAAPTVPTGTGPVPGATFLNFPISDKASLRVNVGSGDALVTTSDLSIPEANGNLVLGEDWNSLLNGTPLHGAGGNDWRQRQGVDTRLYLGSGTTGSITYLGADGLSGVFTTTTGTSYTSPADVHATLVTGSSLTSACSGSAYQLNWHSTGEIQCFNGAGLVTSQQDRNGNTTTFNYTYGLESSVTYTPKGASAPSQTVTGADVAYPYTLQLSQSGGSTGTKNVYYNVNQTTGDLSSIQQADGTTLTFGYDSGDNLNSIENGASVTTTLVYDSSHRVTSVSQTYGTASATATTRFSYVSSTETQVAAPNTNQSQAVSAVPNTTYTINSAELVTKAVDPAGDTVNTAYDSSTNNVTSSQNALTGTTTNTWGSNNGESLTKSASPTGASASAAYSNSPTTADPEAEYLPSSSDDAQGNQSLYTYDGAGNLSQSSDALPATAKVTPNSDGTPSTSTDPDGGVTSYTWNSLQQLTKVTPPTSGSLTAVNLTYDGFGRVATVTDGNGNTLTYTYDLADRITQEAWTGGASTLTVSFAYDGAGNLHTQTSSGGPVTTWTYDGRNQALTVSATSGGGTLSYTYDADGNMLTAVDGAGTTTYVYNDLDQLTSMTDPTGMLWVFSYNAAGERTHTYFDSNASASTYAIKDLLGFDSAGRITVTEANYTSGAGTLYHATYCYSPYVSGTACPAGSATTDTGLLQWSQDALTSTVSQYTYDTGNRVKTASNISGTNYSYGYDGDGNITAGAKTGSVAYNTSNQITTSGWGYDHDGNLTADPHNGTLAYNDASQLISASAANGGGAGSGAETFSYTGAGQNQPLTDGSASAITYGMDDQYGQPRVDSYTAGGGTSYAIRDQQGDPLGIIRGGTSYIYLADNTNGSVTSIDGACGCDDADYTYAPYGTIASKSAGSGGSLVTQNRLTYTGALTDTFTAGSTGYVHDGARWYNPQTGSFAGQDTSSYLNNPANGNRYAYAADNPTTTTDPTGACSILDCINDIVNDVTGINGALFGSPCVSDFTETGVLIGVGIAAVPVTTGYSLLLGGAATVGLAVGIRYEC